MSIIPVNWETRERRAEGTRGTKGTRGQGDKGDKGTRGQGDNYQLPTTTDN
ncbi:hypothetical protein [Chroococcidiopsis cubana]|uniref:hypothetical protein n=1 Tax=Chroococcidiopsis cubana TaxID=171392 RepID=UPI002ACD47F7|nr:hypothetical protein [Chroococcidiopsis cubana]